MSKRFILSDENLIDGARSIAADMQLPHGRRLKLAKVVDNHLVWFEKARARGLEWSDIVDLLYKAGVARSDGRPLSRGHVSSLVWRKQQAKPSHEIPSVPADRRPVATGRMINVPDDLNDETGAPSENRITQEHSPEERPQQSKRTGSVSSSKAKASKSSKEHSDRNEIVAFMRRAAQLRRDE
ncbi:hypothetical protein [Pelagibacterium lacus]|uniref:Uncharacterized protein n=1 Tax=Pelagibacterium lacus TaxID=2282655 RepID=A0A369W2X4_9HYPH|nr:hypothetical protein [Pelagibacterium lacus]RDE07710.1 hypothetical protein DVH29_15340 [Pelagibacterium lacus]